MGWAREGHLGIRGLLAVLMMLFSAGCGGGPVFWTPVAGDPGREAGEDGGALQDASGGDRSGDDRETDPVADDGPAPMELPRDLQEEDGPEDLVGWQDTPTDPGVVPTTDLADSGEDWPLQDPGTQDPGSAIPDPTPGSDASSEEDALQGGLRIRLIAANLTSGNDQSWDLGHGLRILDALDGDVVLVQEFRYGDNTAQDYRRFADQACGPACAWAVGRGQIPNGVVSRWPIVESGAWDDPSVDNRDLDWVRIDLPGPRDLVAISVHLHTSPSSDQVQAAQVVARRVIEYRRAHPGCCWYVVGGDFNGTAAVSASGFGQWDGEPVFFVKPPHPKGEDGSINTNRNRSSQYDFVLLDTELVSYQTGTCFASRDGNGGSRCYPDGLVFDTRDFSQETLDRWFYPARTGDSGAPNMQHMAVVKDVVIP